MKKMFEEEELEVLIKNSKLIEFDEETDLAIYETPEQCRIVTNYHQLNVPTFWAIFCGDSKLAVRKESERYLQRWKEELRESE